MFCGKKCLYKYTRIKWREENPKKEKTLIIKECKYCGNEFGAYNEQKLYCNEICRGKNINARNSLLKQGFAYDHIYEKKCKFCGKDFETTKPNQIYCCKRCSAKYQIELVKEKRRQRFLKESATPRICRNCGKEFIISDFKQVHCSEKCYSQYKRKRIWKRKSQILKEYRANKEITT